MIASPRVVAANRGAQECCAPNLSSELQIFAAVNTSIAWRRRSRDDVLDDAALDIGEAEVAAGVAVRQFGVIEAEQVQDRGL